MGAGSNLHGQDFEGILESIFASTDDLLIVDPMADAVESLTASMTAAEAPPRTRLFADETLLKGVMDDFIVASNAADHMDAGTLSIRTGGTGPKNSLVVADGTVWSLVAAGGNVAALGTDDGTFVDAVEDLYETQWETATSFDLCTPPISRVRETLGDEIGAQAREDFEATLDALQSARNATAEFDEVTLTLLVAARNDVLLYDISKWGEDVGIASKATFSRTKTTLEDEDLIRTEKVPIDVGRPRLRLKLNEDRFDEATPEELAAVTLGHSA